MLTLSGFSPGVEFAGHFRIVLLVGLTRTAILFLIPMITMRLFVEERRSKTIDMLFTSPVREHEIVLGKWIGAMLLSLVILSVSAGGLAVFRSRELDWRLMAAAYAALIAQGAGLLAIGECTSTLTKHENVAAFWTLLICMVVLRYQGTGILSPLDFGFCGALMVGGWLLTWRSVRAIRWAM